MLVWKTVIKAAFMCVCDLVLPKKKNHVHDPLIPPIYMAVKCVK